MKSACNIESTYTLIQKLAKEYKITDDYSSLLSFIGSIRYKKIRHYYLPVFISALCYLDSEIYIEYETTDEENWKEVQSDYNTPLENNELINLRKDIQSFSSAYIELRRFIRNIKMDSIFKCFDEFIIPSTTRNIQFLLFDLCDRDYDSVFKYLINKIQYSNMSSFYIPILSTLLVRYKNINEEDKEIILKWLYKYVKKYKTLINIQFFLYVIIFFHKKDFIKKYLNFCDNLYFNFGNKINKVVCSMYANIFSKKDIYSVIRSEDDLLKLFPFDSPIINKIQDIYINSYVEFEP